MQRGATLVEVGGKLLNFAVDERAHFSGNFRKSERKSIAAESHHGSGRCDALRRFLAPCKLLSVCSFNVRLLFSPMSAAEIIEQFKALPAKERAKVTKFVVENDDSWIPESFKKGMADAEAGRFADMENVLSGCKPPPRAAK